jgi:two-component system alkaline phosphatase synthesis response regulator PhoP
MESEQPIILVADDEKDILEILQYQLEKNGFKVYTANHGNDAIEKAKKLNPNLIILDIMMPYKTGIEVCKQLRELLAFKETPIVLLTALNDEITHVKGLDVGADDFISKPVSNQILLSRINALLRRTQKSTELKTLTIGEITINTHNYSVTVNNQEIVLAKKEFELLHLLASNPKKVFLRNEILQQVWGQDVIVGDRTIDVHIRKIRQKLNIDCISTLKGIGYKFAT